MNKHERLSSLHRDNLKNQALVSKALSKLGQSVPTPPAAEPESAEYRDRAQERRVAFNQAKAPKPLKKEAWEARPVSATASSNKKEPSPEAPPAQSKGASLLGKMGYKAGQGLGASGTGSIAPIPTEMYVAGVGLGASGGKVGDAVVEAGRNTKSSYGDFLEKTRDKAKERYKEMQ